MEPCYACGASMSAETDWCGQCYAPRGRASSAPSSIMAPTRPVPVAATLPPQVIKTRWRKTTTTFGPVGRVLATLGLVIPFVIFVVIGVLTGGLTIFGAVIWGFIIMPWGLRDTWRAGQLPVK
jgi:hypothetical protein